MSREDFLDAPQASVDGPAAATTSPPSRPPRPLHGGWVLMIAAGLIAAVANYALLAGADPVSPVAVLTADAPVGTPVGELQVTTTDVPLDDPGVHHLLDGAALDRLSGQVTASALPAGALLRRTDLRVPQGEGEGAMSLPAETTRTVGGLLQPGDRIDVIAGAARAGVVARDLPVLAVTDGGGAIGAPGGGSVVVAVDRDEALALAQALRDGQLDIVRVAQGPGG